MLFKEFTLLTIDLFSFLLLVSVLGCGCCRSSVEQAEDEYYQSSEYYNPSDRVKARMQQEMHRQAEFDIVLEPPLPPSSLSEEDRLQLLQRRQEYGTKLHKLLDQTTISEPQVLDIILQCPDACHYVNDETGDNALHVICNKRHIPAVSLGLLRALVKQWPEAVRHPNQQEGNLPLHCAVQAGVSDDIIQYLIDEWNRSVTIANQVGMIPLHLAC